MYKTNKSINVISEQLGTLDPNGGNLGVLNPNDGGGLGVLNPNGGGGSGGSGGNSRVVTGSQPKTWDPNCTKILKKGCKDANASRTNPDKTGIIYRLQEKLTGLTLDGYFGKYTEAALKEAIGKTEVSVEDAKVMIEGHGSGTSSVTAKTPEEQKTFFDGLIKDKYIRDGNLLKINTPQITALDGKTIYAYAYVKKFEAVRDKNGNLISVGNVLSAPKSTEISFSDNTLFVFFFYDYFWAFLDKEGIDDTNKNLKWDKGKAQITFGDLSEQKVDFSSILGKSSSESNVIDGITSGGGSGSSSVIQKSEYGVLGQKSTEDEKNSSNKDETTTKQKFDSITFCKSAKNRQDQLRCMFGFINDEGVTFSPRVKIETMNVDQSKGIAGEGSIQFAITNYAARSNYFDDFNELMDIEGLSTESLTYPDNYPNKNYAGETIDDDNSSGLIPLEGDAATQYREFTFGKFLGTNSTLKIYLMQSGRQAAENLPAACTDSPDVVRERLKTYLKSAFLGTRSTVNVYENLPYLNRCVATNVLNDLNFTAFTRSDFMDVNDDRLPFSMLKKELKLSDVKKLIRGLEVGKIQLKSQFVDEYFATDRAVYESLNTKIKRRITEAIKTKEKVKIKNRIITEILLEMKR